MGGLIARLRDSVLANPFVWFFFALFLFVEYSNYQKGVLIDRMCELTARHEAGFSHPKTAAEELDIICVDRSLEGEDD